VAEALPVHANEDEVQAKIDQQVAELLSDGARRRTALAGLLLGGVTHRLLHIAHCPVADRL
jgi:nucleotide-binding universal stress UspA family protein